MEAQNPTQPQTQIVSPASPPITTPTPEQPSEPKPKLSKWIMAAVVILVLIIVGSATAYFLNKNSASKTQTPVTQTVVKPTPASNAAPADPTSNWKTYTTDEYLDIDKSMMTKFPAFKKTRMSFRYPSWLEVNKVDLTTARANYSNSVVNMGLDLTNSEYRTSHGGPNDYSAGMLFSFATVPENLKDFDKSFWGGAISNQITRTGEKTINGIRTTFAYEPSTTLSPGSLTPSGVLFHLSPTQQVYVLVSFFSFDDNCTSKQCRSMANDINQIFSTFKFTDQASQTDETASWKTYKDQDWQITYPPNLNLESYIDDQRPYTSFTNTKSLPESDSVESGMSLTIAKYTKSSGKTLLDFAKEFFKDSAVYIPPFEKITVNEFPGVSSAYSSGMDGEHQAIFLQNPPNNENVYYIEIYTGNSKKHEEIGAKMLTTFKFTQ